MAVSRGGRSLGLGGQFAFSGEEFPIFREGNREPRSRDDAERWAENEGAAALESQNRRRRVVQAALGDKELQRRIVAAAKEHMGALVDLALDKKLGAAACTMLRKISGKILEPGQWADWWRANKDKIGEDGRLRRS